MRTSRLNTSLKTETLVRNKLFYLYRVFQSQLMFGKLKGNVAVDIVRFVRCRFYFAENIKSTPSDIFAKTEVICAKMNDN